MIAVGTARPMAQGQAMISTDTAEVNARTAGAASARRYHATKVAIAIEITAGTNTALIRSASRWSGARDACASRSSLTIRASVLADPRVVAR